MKAKGTILRLIDAYKKKKIRTLDLHIAICDLNSERYRSETYRPSDIEAARKRLIDSCIMDSEGRFFTSIPDNLSPELQDHFDTKHNFKIKLRPHVLKSLSKMSAHQIIASLYIMLRTMTQRFNRVRVNCVYVSQVLGISLKSAQRAREFLIRKRWLLQERGTINNRVLVCFCRYGRSYICKFLSHQILNQLRIWFFETSDINPYIIKGKNYPGGFVEFEFHRRYGERSTNNLFSLISF